MIQNLKTKKKSFQKANVRMFNNTLKKITLTDNIP